MATDANTGWGLQLSSTGSPLLQQATLAFLMSRLREENKAGEVKAEAGRRLKPGLHNLHCYPHHSPWVESTHREDS